jgi:hypothetical protein
MRLPVYLQIMPRYHRLHPSSEGEGSYTDVDEYLGQQLKRPTCHAIIITSVVVPLAISLITVSTLYLQLLHDQAPRTLLTCGKSVKEAQEAGCSFDRLTKTWLPAACPRYYEEDFVRYPSTLNITEWRYWTDLSATEEITDDDMALFAGTKPGRETSWVSSLRMHIAHCAFGLMRRSYALDAGERIDLATLPLEHTRHCIELLLEAAMHAPGIDVPLAEGKVIFGAC